MKMRWLVIGALAGCTQQPTSTLSAHFSLEIQNGQLFVGAGFHIGEGNDIALGDNDRVVARVHGEQLLLSRYEDYYAGRFTLDAPLVDDEPISIELHRDGETSAPESTILVPPEPVIVALPLFVSRSHDFPVTWSPTTDDQMFWDANAMCVEQAQGDIPAGTGTFTIPAGTLKARDAGFQPTCTTTLELVRLRAGTLDPAFAGGRISFRRTSQGQFASMP